MSGETMRKERRRPGDAQRLASGASEASPLHAGVRQRGLKPGMEGGVAIVDANGVLFMVA